MTTRRAIPTYEQPISIGNKTSSTWYRWFGDVDSGTPPSDEKAVTPTVSPFSYQAPSRGYVLISGGTVSQVAFSRTAGVSYITGQTAGMFSVSLGDVLTVTYSGVPTMVFIPS